MTSNPRSDNLLRLVSAEVTCVIGDKNADAIYLALKPDMSEIGRDAKVELSLKGGAIHFEVSSADLGLIKALLTSFLKLLGAASSTINAVSF